MTRQSITPLARCCAGICVAVLLAGCGMKGPLRHPEPPPADAQLAAPPTVAVPPAPAQGNTLRP